MSALVTQLEAFTVRVQQSWLRDGVAVTIGIEDTEADLTYLHLTQGQAQSLVHEVAALLDELSESS